MGSAKMFTRSGWIRGFVVLLLLGSAIFAFLIAGWGASDRADVLGAVIVALAIAGSACVYASDERPAPTWEVRMLSWARRLSRWLALGAFPIGFFISSRNRSNPQPPNESADNKKNRELSRELARDNAVDAYVLAWTVGLIALWTISLASQPSAKGVSPAVTVFAWIAAYRVADILVGRFHILTTYAGNADFSVVRARRSLLGSMIVLGQVILAFALMFDGWTGGSRLQWGGQHQLLGFSYVSTRVIFTLGPPYEPIGQLAKFLVGAELLAGLAVIGLGLATYVGALSSGRQPPP